MSMMDSQKLALRRERGRLAVMIVAGTFVVLAGAFFRLQIIAGDEYVLRSEENRFRAITVPAPRGTIYDRNGRVLAENVPGYVISILPGPRDTMAATIDRLADRLGIEEDEREDLLTQNRQRPNEPLVVRRNADFEQVSYVEERRPEFRRVVVEAQPRRRYPMGPANAHFVGYVSQITEQQLEMERWEQYEQGRVIGQSGLELQYEESLSGTPGVRYVEVNALGSIVRDFDVGRGQPAVPGEDLYLGIDLDLQELAAATFPDTMRGGVVALDPTTGEVLTFYSHPTFDPNEFIGGIPLRLWNELQADPAEPLYNRVSSAAYPPGSTWKLVMSAIGMQRGQLDIDTYMSNSCRGSLRYGNRSWACWNSAGHGPENLSGAIQGSCNVYFYQAGDRIGLDALMEHAIAYEFDQRTGIDLPYEVPGRFPDSREWFDQQWGPRGWTESVVWNLSIGQGENLQSLLGMSTFYSALATGESPIRPHLARDENLNERRVEWNLGISEAQRLDLVEAMRTVVNEPGGTAYQYRINDWEIVGKTGTAQSEMDQPHSWFVGFAPPHDPKIVIASIVEQGHPDGTVSLAVPYAFGIVERHLQNLGLPSDLRPPAAVAAGSGSGVDTGG